MSVGARRAQDSSESWALASRACSAGSGAPDSGSLLDVAGLGLLSIAVAEDDEGDEPEYSAGDDEASVNSGERPAGSADVTRDGDSASCEDAGDDEQYGSRLPCPCNHSAVHGADAGKRATKGHGAEEENQDADGERHFCFLTVDLVCFVIYIIHRTGRRHAVRRRYRHQFL